MALLALQDRHERPSGAAWRAPSPIQDHPPVARGARPGWRRGAIQAALQARFQGARFQGAGLQHVQALAGLVAAATLFFAGAVPLSMAQTFSSQFAGFIAGSGEPINIEADQLDVVERDKAARFTGNVVVTQGPVELRADILEVVYRGVDVSGVAGNIVRMAARGDVALRAPGQSVSAGEVSFDLATKTMILTGDPVSLAQDGGALTGDRLEIDLDSGVARLDSGDTGRVRFSTRPEPAP